MPEPQDRKDPKRRGASFTQEEAELGREAISRYYAGAAREHVREQLLGKFERMTASFRTS